MAFKDKLLVGFGKQLTDKDGNFYAKSLVQRVNANTANIMSKYVVDYSSGMSRPKFVNQRGQGVNLKKKKTEAVY